MTEQGVLVLADDFTGANDAGVSFAERGMTTDVVFDPNYQGTAQAVIVNSDSRAKSPDVAAIIVQQLLANIATRIQPRWMVKKIDSTLRGNLGAELEAAIKVLGVTAAVVAPAYPAAGRVTRNGHCYVNGALLTDTEFATDPKTPVSRADIVGLLQLQTSLPCRVVTSEQLADVLQSSDALIPQILIVDAQDDAHLEQIVSAVATQSLHTLLVGSAGICDALARHVTRTKTDPLLAVVGSMSEIAQQQMAALMAHPNVVKLDVDIHDAFCSTANDYVYRAMSILQQGNHCLISTCSTHSAREHIDDLCHRLGMSRAELGENICTFIASLVGEVLSKCTPGALYLSGGDIAIAVARELGASGFRITGRVAQCVPLGRFLGGRWQRPVMTKAGGFGDEMTLSDVVNYIEEKVRD